MTRRTLEQNLRLVNAGAVLMAAASAAVLASLLLGPDRGAGRVALLVLIVVVVAVAVAFVNDRLARSLLAPLREIERTLSAAEQGDLRARAALPTDADAGLARAAGALNRLLAGIVSDRQRLRDVAARAFRAQEAERLRIARELQEETAQSLTTVLFLLRAARQTQDDAGRDDLLDELRDSLTRTTDSIRGYARTLHPPSLKELGLVPALESYARALSGSSGLQIRILGDDIQGLLSVEGELALYRIVQEALGNVVRHASAASVMVRVRNAGDHVRTWVEDDGKGFPLEETEARLPCLGLFGMRERALSVGGTVEIDSIPGDGTQVRISIPAARNPAAAPAAWPIILRPEAAPGAVPERGPGAPG
jgi:two-component system, NarL family, sensor histidine kinase UhpB